MARKVPWIAVGRPRWRRWRPGDSIHSAIRGVALCSRTRTATRYGRFVSSTCSIEDDIVEARALGDDFNAA